ncbi:hypothetical protein SDC9_191014 [bioreactor metagenome]|uniref:Uncharacterized protein n=1 Tax=bioreactor metagenome TaxID=1076179 RepID=A0A645I4W5_9ZZZZ
MVGIRDILSLVNISCAPVLLELIAGLISAVTTISPRLTASSFSSKSNFASSPSESVTSVIFVVAKPIQEASI